ncbi:hypothetical protein ACFSRY_19300 [Pontibacter locisalis]|uniref:Uncharacterized protein n=1 Tax=Pontibacter locisalis TaxID=1719035 RepID=A0ABW5IRE4_9BACT
MRNFLPHIPEMKLKQLQKWTKLRHEQLSEATSITTDSVVDFIKRQIVKGNWREVEEVLKGKPLTATGKLLFSEMRNRVIGTLMLRLGLRRVVALAIALILLPLILAKISGETISRLRK